MKQYGYDWVKFAAILKAIDCGRWLLNKGGRKRKLDSKTLMTTGSERRKLISFKFH